MRTVSTLVVTLVIAHSLILLLLFASGVHASHIGHGNNDYSHHHRRLVPYDDTHHHQRLVPRVTSCTKSSQCSSSHFCSSGKCTKKQSTGGTCTKNVGCTSDVCYSSVCLGSTDRPLSAPCTTSTECTTGYCGHGVCAKKRSVGKACYKNAGCKSGYCNTSASTCQATTTSTITSTSTSTKTTPSSSSASSSSTKKSTTSVLAADATAATTTTSTTKTSTTTTSTVKSTASTSSSKSTISSSTSTSSSVSAAAGGASSTAVPTTTTTTTTKTTKPFTGTLLASSTQTVGALPTVTGTLLPNGDFSSGNLSPYTIIATDNGSSVAVGYVGPEDKIPAAVATLNISGAMSLSYDMSDTTLTGYSADTSYVINFLSAVSSMNKISDAKAAADECIVSVTNEENNNTMVTYSYSSFMSGEYNASTWYASSYEILDGAETWSINIVCDAGISGTFYLDELTYSPPETDTDGYDDPTELLANGDFSTGVITPWTLSTQVYEEDDTITALVNSDSSVAYSGSDYLSLHLTNGGNLTLTTAINSSSAALVGETLQWTTQYRIIHMNYTDSTLLSSGPLTTCSLTLSTDQGDTNSLSPLYSGWYSTDQETNQVDLPMHDWELAWLTFEAGVSQFEIRLQCQEGVEVRVLFDDMAVQDITDS